MPSVFAVVFTGFDVFVHNVFFGLCQQFFARVFQSSGRNGGALLACFGMVLHQLPQQKQELLFLTVDLLLCTLLRTVFVSVVGSA